jgi:hypothetical protein
MMRDVADQQRRRPGVLDVEDALQRSETWLLHHVPDGLTLNAVECVLQVDSRQM